MVELCLKGCSPLDFLFFSWIDFQVQAQFDWTSSCQTWQPDNLTTCQTWQLYKLKFELELENQSQTSGSNPWDKALIILGTWKGRLKFFYLGPSNLQTCAWAQTASGKAMNRTNSFRIDAYFEIDVPMKNWRYGMEHYYLSCCIHEGPPVLGLNCSCCVNNTHQVTLECKNKQWGMDTWTHCLHNWNKVINGHTSVSKSNWRCASFTSPLHQNQITIRFCKNLIPVWRSQPTSWKSKIENCTFKVLASIQEADRRNLLTGFGGAHCGRSCPLL